jgi:hypothetical protein
MERSETRSGPLPAKLADQDTGSDAGKAGESQQIGKMLGCHLFIPKFET